MDSKRVGIWGEKIAEDYLKKKGYQILDKNYSIRFDFGPKRGEVDIVARQKDAIVFVEVKTVLQKKRREQFSSFFPESKVNFEKQRKIIKTAHAWLMENKFPLESKWQVDILAVQVIPARNSARIRHFKNIVC